MKSLVFSLALLAIGCHADPIVSTTASNVMTGLFGNAPSLSPASEVQSTTCECGSSRSAESRIINGRRTAWAGHVTVTAQIVNKTTGRIHCSGSIITPRHILTVAHSLVGAASDEFIVTVGNPYNEYKTGKVGPYTQKLEVEEIFLHNYTGAPDRYNDIAILLLKAPIELNQYVRVACLPKDNSDDLDYQRAVIAGWGYYRNNSAALENEILSSEVKILDAAQCNKVWPSVQQENPTQVCVDSPTHRAAQGDSGSPVQWYDESIDKWVEVGIVSYGSLNRNVHYPRVNTKVSEYLDWIKFVLSSTTQDQICTKQ